MARSAGYDVIGYALATGHLYLAGSSCGCLVRLGVSAEGVFRRAVPRTAPPSATCRSVSSRSV
ncbi:MAG TPA: hypothetical protein VNO55_17660 [Polyangia bacterium]|nr:hypothetical protein [Polyangia bacterium]